MEIKENYQPVDIFDIMNTKFSRIAIKEIYGPQLRGISLVEFLLKKGLNGNYRIYSIKRPGRLLNFWTLRVGAYLRLGAY